MDLQPIEIEERLDLISKFLPSGRPSQYLQLAPLDAIEIVSRYLVTLE